MRLNKKQENTVIAALLGVVVVLLVSILFDTNVAPSQFTKSLLGISSEQSEDGEKNLEHYISQVAPTEGYTVSLKWGDTGTKLVQAGGIDLEKYLENYSDEQYQELLTYLTQDKEEGITITQDNAYFWVNTLWALGLTQNSQVLDEGIMGTEYKDDIGTFASTGGWTLGSKDAVSLYSSSLIVPLTSEQQSLVAEVSRGIYRPCCGNPTSFPDCNHGMAILGLLELMASQNFTKEEMYKASLAFNSYWFTQTYADLAFYFDTVQNTSWEQVPPQEILGVAYSSAQGYQAIKEQIGNIPGAPVQGGSCGA